MLHGSRGANRARPDSDVDVAVLLPETSSPSERFETRRKLASDLEDLGRPDIIVLNDAPPFLAHRALQGDKIFVRDQTAYVRFFVRTIAASEDERHWRELHAARRRERLEEGRFGRP